VDRLERLEIGDREVEDDHGVDGAGAPDRNEPRQLVAVLMGRDHEMGDATGGRVDDDVGELAEVAVLTAHGTAEVERHAAITAAPGALDIVLTG